MDSSAILALLAHGNQLKRTVRTGWVQRGIVDAEDVAAHSYGVVFIALIMAEVIPDLDKEALLTMAVLHDLPEGITSDIPTPAWRMLPPGSKQTMEREAMRRIFGDGSSGQRLMRFWLELQKNESLEAKLVHDCDKLDMLLQAYNYERQAGNQQLAEFWEHEYDFNFEATRSVFEALTTLRSRGD